jgi:hypothetical protein
LTPLSFDPNDASRLMSKSMLKPMSTTTTPAAPAPALPEIDATDLKAARRFLTSFRDEERRARMPHAAETPHGPVLRNGITRARTRSANKPSA